MNERNLEDILNDYYRNAYIEDTRLTKDKTHYVEFVTTTRYIEKYLKKGDKILEIGAGTGTYSLYYANKGYQVDAIELVQANIDVMKSKIKDSNNVKVLQGNAIDLSMYDDNTFDITLVLGPLYHLFKTEEINKAIEEAIRVTKIGGKIYFAFILFDLTMLTWGFQSKNIFDNIGINKQVLTDFTPNNQESFIFNMKCFSEVKELMSKFNIKVLNYVATDGIGKLMKENINQMSEEEYNLYINYHLSICERQDLIGYSGHILSIVTKNI